MVKPKVDCACCSGPVWPRGQGDAEIWWGLSRKGQAERHPRMFLYSTLAKSLQLA